MNEIIKAMKERRSIRKFKPDMPPKMDIEQIVDAGLYAANGMGKQAVITVAVTNKALRDRLAEANRKIGGWQEGFEIILQRLIQGYEKLKGTPLQGMLAFAG